MYRERRGDGKSDATLRRSAPDLHLKLSFLGTGEDDGIHSVAVKRVDIRRNASGAGGLLDRN